MGNQFYRRDHGVTLTEAAYGVIKRGPASTSAVAAELGVSMTAACEAIQRLRKAGCVRLQRVHLGAVWHAVKKPRKDGRGKSKGSREALRLHWRVTPSTYRNIKRHPKAVPTTAIEQAWGWGVAHQPSPPLLPSSECD
jgi:hypothetical protein